MFKATLVLPDAKFRSQPCDAPCIMLDHAKAMIPASEMLVLGIYQGDLVLPEQFIEVHNLSPFRRLREYRDHATVEPQVP
ncbi:MAG: hypothetical protein KDE25_05625 [Novosphingobium sp.]|nr:hypothetical protein [Novosphingobium sp.]